MNSVSGITFSRRHLREIPGYKRKRRYILPGIFLLLIVYLAVNVCSIVFYSGKDETRDADTAIVLGAAASESGVSEVFRQRLNHSIELYENGTVNTIIVTGGVGIGNTRSDAEIGKEYLIGQGITKEVILIEGNSAITQENLVNAKMIMEENGMETALIVSDPLHMKRAMLLAKDAGLTAFSGVLSNTPEPRQVCR